MTERVVVAGSLWSVPEAERASAVAAAGVRRLHWDTTDGRFAVAGGFSPDSAAALIDATGTSAEAHIMAEEPLAVVDAWAELCDTVIVHAESDGWRAAVDRIERRGSRPGLALSPQTPAATAPDELVVLCMSIVPGQAGSRFDLGVLSKVTALREAAPDRPVGLDGGVTRAIADTAIAAGATFLTVGTDLFSPGGAERWADLLAAPAPA